MNIANIQEKLVKNNYYNNIFDVCSNERKKVSIRTRKKCRTRIDNVSDTLLNNGFVVRKTPCRSGRKLKCMRHSCKKTNKRYCPLCYFTRNRLKSVCVELNSNVVTKLSKNFVLIPNAFPYLDNQFLITVRSHKKQMDIINKYCVELYRVFVDILKNNEDGKIFFNGDCGNSLEHFHCQFTTTEFPIFLELPDFDGIINNKRFRGYYVKVYSSSKFRDLIRILTNKGISFNFILQKGIYNYFDVVFFVRNCNRILTKDLNFGATELAGLINTRNGKFKAKEIAKYMEETNNIINYNVFNEGDESITRSMIKSSLLE